MITLYNETGGPLPPIPFAEKFTGRGLGFLRDAISCEVEEKLDGELTATMTYPVGGALFKEIKNNRIFMARTNISGTEQPFRIKKITRPISGVVTIIAEHIRYDLSGIPCDAFQAENANEALDFVGNIASEDGGFHVVWTRDFADIPFENEMPRSVAAVMGGEGGKSLADVYEAEWEFNGNNCFFLHAGSRGSDNGVTIRYGKNLIDLKQEESIQETITGIFPYWMQETENGKELVTLTERIIYAPGTHPVQVIATVDMTKDFEAKPTENQLRAKATEYVGKAGIGVPNVTLTVSFQNLAETVEYQLFANLETVSLGDTVTVIFEDLGVNAKARVTETVYDAVRERYKSITLGNQTQKVAQTIAGIEKRVEGLATGETSVSGDSLSAGSIKSENYAPPESGGLFASNGTLMNLWNGELISKFLKISKAGTVYIGGIAFLNNDGTVMMSTIASDGTLTNAFRVTENAVDIRRALTASAGGGAVLYIEPSQGRLNGTWKATPYTDPEESESEIVTKKDLQELGLIP